MTPTQRRVFVEAADACRAIQATYQQQARKTRGQQDIKDLLTYCATGAGACAADLEARAGLSLEEMCKRATARRG